MIVYPRCPECGEVAAHQPAVNGGGRFCYLVYHDHGCRVSKYAACINDNGQQENIPIHGERFEDVMGDAA